MEGENNIRRTPRKRELASCDDLISAGRTTRKICTTDTSKSSPDKFYDSRHINSNQSQSPRLSVLGSRLKVQDISDILNSDSDIDTNKSPARNQIPKRQATSIKRKIFTNSPAKSKDCNPKTKNQAYILEEQNDSILNIPMKILLKEVKYVTAVLKDKTETFEKTLGSAKKLRQLSNGVDESFGSGLNRQINIVSPIKRQSLLNKFSSPSKFVNDLEENDKNLTRTEGSPNNGSKFESEKYQKQASESERNSGMLESAVNETPKKVNPSSATRSARTRRKIVLSPVKTNSPAIALKHQYKEKLYSTPKRRGRKIKVNNIVDDEEINENELVSMLIHLR